MPVHGVSHDTPWCWWSSSPMRCKNGSDWLRPRNHIYCLGPSKYSTHFTCKVVILSLYWSHQFCPVDTRYPSVRSTEHQHSCNRRELISTGRETHEVSIKRMSSAQPVGTFSVEVCSKFCACSKLATDWSNLTWQGTHFTACHQITSIQATYANWYKWIENRRLSLMSVDAIRQGVTPL